MLSVIVILAVNDGLVFDGADDYVSIDEMNISNLTWKISFKLNEKFQIIISNQESRGCAIYT